MIYQFKKTRVLAGFIVIATVISICILSARRSFQQIIPDLRYSTEHPGIPLIIHQSWKDPTPPDTEEIRSWKELNPKHRYMYWTDRDMDEFIRSNHSSIHNFYASLPLIMKSDFFRYLIVLKYGGIWSDIDTKCLKPFDHWMSLVQLPPGRSINCIIGVELDASTVTIDWFSVKLQFTQWTFAATPGHPLLQHVANTILYKHFATDIKGGPHLITGPTIWTEAIVDYFARQGFTDTHSLRGLNEPVLVGDVLVLPVTGFSPDNLDLKGKGPDHRLSLVQHMFRGSWKQRKYD